MKHFFFSPRNSESSVLLRKNEKFSKGNISFCLAAIVSWMSSKIVINWKTRQREQIPFLFGMYKVD